MGVRAVSETYRPRLCDHDVAEIRRVHAAGASVKQIARTRRIRESTIERIVTRRSYQNVPDDVPAPEPGSCRRCIDEQIRVANKLHFRSLTSTARCYSCHALFTATAAEVLGAADGRALCESCTPSVGLAS